jgi:hypothetical protein
VKRYTEALSIGVLGVFISKRWIIDKQMKYVKKKKKVYETRKKSRCG